MKIWFPRADRAAHVDLFTHRGRIPLSRRRRGCLPIYLSPLGTGFAFEAGAVAKGAFGTAQIPPWWRRMRTVMRIAWIKVDFDPLTLRLWNTQGLWLSGYELRQRIVSRGYSWGSGEWYFCQSEPCDLNPDEILEARVCVTEGNITFVEHGTFRSRACHLTPLRRCVATPPQVKSPRIGVLYDQEAHDRPELLRRATLSDPRIRL
jgi:hypothetical protein